MPDENDKREAKLRVVEEEDKTEEVMRLGRKGKPPEGVARIALPEVPEAAERLENEGLEDIGRRTLEPDIDAILDGEEEAENLEEKWSSDAENKPVPHGWFVLIFLVLTGLVATSIAVFHNSGGGEQVEQAKQASVDSEAEEVEEEREATELVERIEETMVAYLSAKTVDEMLPHVREPERIEPMMRDWYLKNPLEPQEFERLKVFQPFDIEGRAFWVMTCGLRGQEDISVLMEQTKDSRVLIDWETQVCYQPMSWDQYIAERPDDESMDFRVYMTPDFDGFFSHEFSREEDWIGYVLTAMGSNDYLIGYVKRGSPVSDRLLASARKVRGRTMAYYLRLRVPKDAESPRGVIIEDALSDRWALIKPYE